MDCGHSDRNCIGILSARQDSFIRLITRCELCFCLCWIMIFAVYKLMADAHHVKDRAYLPCVFGQKSLSKQCGSWSEILWESTLIAIHPAIFRHPLRKHAYPNTLKILPPKNGNFSHKKSDIFHISAQNIDCGYSLEPPRRGGSNEYPQFMFWAEITKIMYTPVNPSFTV